MREPERPVARLEQLPEWAERHAKVPQSGRGVLADAVFRERLVHLLLDWARISIHENVQQAKILLIARVWCGFHPTRHIWRRTFREGGQAPSGRGRGKTSHLYWGSCLLP